MTLEEKAENYVRESYRNIFGKGPRVLTPPPVLTALSMSAAYKAGYCEALRDVLEQAERTQHTWGDMRDHGFDYKDLKKMAEQLTGYAEKGTEK